MGRVFATRSAALKDVTVGAGRYKTAKLIATKEKKGLPASRGTDLSKIFLKHPEKDSEIAHAIAKPKSENPCQWHPDVFSSLSFDFG